MRTLSLALLAAGILLLAPTSHAQKDAPPADTWYGVILPEGTEMVRTTSLRIESGDGTHTITAGRQTLKTTGDINILMAGLARGERSPDAQRVAACASRLPVALKMGPPPQARGGTTTTSTTTTTISEDGKTTTTTTTTTTTNDDGSSETTTTTTMSPADPMGECPTSY